LVPSDRVIVPRSDAVAEPVAVTVPDAVTGGHAPAQAPEHWDASPVSFTHRYTARPDPSVRNVAPDAVAVVITVPAEDPPPDEALPVADAPVPDAPELGGLLVLLAHAVTSSAVPTAATNAAPTLSPGDTCATTVRSPAPILATMPRGLQAGFLAATSSLIFVFSSQLPTGLTT
jgi:hypothetical protein